MTGVCSAGSKALPQNTNLLHLHNDTLNRETTWGTEIVGALDQILCVSAFFKKRVLTVLPNVVSLKQFPIQTNWQSERPTLVFLGRFLKVLLKSSVRSNDRRAKVFGSGLLDAIC